MDEVEITVSQREVVVGSGVGVAASPRRVLVVAADDEEAGGWDAVTDAADEAIAPAPLIDAPPVSEPAGVSAAVDAWLRLLFMYYVRYGRTLGQTELVTLDVARWAKFCRDTPGVLAAMHENEADLAFVRARAPGTRRIAYDAWLRALGTLARRMFPHVAPEAAFAFFITEHVLAGPVAVGIAKAAHEGDAAFSPPGAAGGGGGGADGDDDGDDDGGLHGGVFKDPAGGAFGMSAAAAAGPLRSATQRASLFSELRPSPVAGALDARTRACDALEGEPVRTPTDAAHLRRVYTPGLAPNDAWSPSDAARLRRSYWRASAPTRGAE
jgi:hypothetical protein